MLPVGAPLPRLHARPVSGRSVDTDVLGARGPVGLVLLRHGGSPVTRATLTALDRAWDDLETRQVSLVAVLEGDLRAAYDVVPRLKIRFPVVHDADGQFYARFGVGRDAGLVRTLADPRSAARWIATFARAGHGAPGGPLDRRCAAYVANAGLVTWAWEGRTIVELLPVDAMVAATNPGR